MKRKLLSKEEKRVFEVKVRLNIKEKRKLDTIVSLTQNNSPEVIRSLLMKAKMPEAIPPILDVQTYQQLRKIGVNFNQYVKAINQSRIAEIDGKTMKELYEILQIIKSKIYSV
ncbi:hypothetical protein [Sphingobacterium hungaricum]|uniref:Mobilisation protein (MobC) n=1 Tax=Sphingobacterium hungaricum TaxID=2082723 RepID=A0A928YRP1_9SPHI|nr:hypothetical protein [Sphingobacterium hungaricum]MBE8714375.1 hypothetical protein [Sphingobacterium hungaricum]